MISGRREGLREVAKSSGEMQPDKVAPPRMEKIGGADQEAPCFKPTWKAINVWPVL